MTDADHQQRPGPGGYAARFADVAFTDVRKPVYDGPDVAAALDWVRRCRASQRRATAGDDGSR